MNLLDMGHGPVCAVVWRARVRELLGVLRRLMPSRQRPDVTAANLSEQRAFCESYRTQYQFGLSPAHNFCIFFLSVLVLKSPMFKKTSTWQVRKLVIT